MSQCVQYLKHPQAYDDPKPRESKLQAISADQFGDSVLAFYQQAIANQTADDQEDGPQEAKG